MIEIKEDAPRFDSPDKNSYPSGDAKFVSRRSKLFKFLLVILLLIIFTSIKNQTDLPFNTALGFSLLIIGNLWLTVIAFNKSAFWGLITFLNPLGSLIFFMKYWKNAKIAFIISLSGLVLFLIKI